MNFRNLLIVALIAFGYFSTNTIEITPDSTSPEFSAKLSANAASHTQLDALFAEGF